MDSRAGKTPDAEAGSNGNEGGGSRKRHYGSGTNPTDVAITAAPGCRGGGGLENSEAEQ
jgi:hypothetical protein